MASNRDNDIDLWQLVDFNNMIAKYADEGRMSCNDFTLYDMQNMYFDTRKPSERLKYDVFKQKVEDLKYMNFDTYEDAEEAQKVVSDDLQARKAAFKKESLN